jgi:hypothetical protein
LITVVGPVTIEPYRVARAAEENIQKEERNGAILFAWLKTRESGEISLGLSKKKHYITIHSRTGKDSGFATGIWILLSRLEDQKHTT